MNRRDFLRTAGGTACAAGAAGAAASPAAASGVSARTLLQDEGEEDGAEDGEDGEEGEEGDESESDLPGAGETEEVTVGPGGDLVFEPEELYVLPGTTVQFVWDSDNHNVVVESGPDEGWGGYETVEDEGFEHEHTFEVEGEYQYVCEPHAAADMEGEIIVTTDVPEEDDHEEEDPAHIGVPIQKHFVGIATFLAIFVTFVFTFYVLKYGESAHTSAPGKK